MAVKSAINASNQADVKYIEIYFQIIAVHLWMPIKKGEEHEALGPFY